MIDLQFVKQNTAKIAILALPPYLTYSRVNFECNRLHLYETILTAIAENCQLPDLLAKEVLKLKNL